jgi:hypothetical protein
MWYYLILMNFSVYLAMVFSCLFLSVCAQGYPIGGESIYSLSIHFVDTVIGACAKMF